MNPNWIRWVIASINKHFDALKGDTYLFIQGDERPNNITKDFNELRIDGPHFSEVSKGVWKLEVTINVLTTIIKDENDLYKLQKNVGIYAPGFVDIKLYKYGDDASYFGCLLLSGRVELTNYGQNIPETRILQSTLEANYLTTLTE